MAEELEITREIPNFTETLTPEKIKENKQSFKKKIDKNSSLKTQQNNSLQKICSQLCYPLLIAIAATTTLNAIINEQPFGLVNVLFLFFVIAYLALFERIIPYEKDWQATGKEWARDFAYLIITMLGGALSVAAIFGIASFTAPKVPHMPMALEVAAAIAVSSLGTYVFHRLGHEWPLLWRFHGIHHAESKVNVGNNSVNHVFDVFGRRLLAQLPIVFIGISEQSLFIASIFNTMQGYFVHANVNVKIGPLNYLFGSPEQHRLHHSTKVAEAGHYSVDITVWDWIFKSYTWKKNKKPAAVGLSNPSSFPSPNAILKSFIHPFKFPR